jgi:hypothetical protein
MGKLKKYQVVDNNKIILWGSGNKYLSIST